MLRHALLLARLFLLARCSAVLELGDSNFSSLVKVNSESTFWFIEFYAPWCGHCKSLAPVWEQLAEQLQGIDVNVAKVDGTEESEAAEQFNVLSYPTLLLFAQGSVYEYSGQRTLDDLLAFARGGFSDTDPRPSFASPVESVVVSLTAASFNETVKNGEEHPWFIEFYAPWCGHCKQLAPVWERMAWQLKDEVEVVQVGKVDVTVETALTERFDVERYPTLIFIAKGEVFRLPAHLDRTLDNLMTFANGEYNKTGRPLPPPRADSRVVELKEKNFNQLVRGSKLPWFVKFYAPWCGHCKELVPAWDELADELDGQVRLGKVDVTSHTELADDFNVTGFPTLMLFAEGRVHTYPYQRTVPAMKRYALGEYSHLTANTSLPLLPPRPAPAAVDLDAEDFWKSVGRGEPTPWFLKFHVPECGFCKTLKPEWESMARELKGKVNVGNVNCELEHELAKAWNVDRFPTTKFIIDGKIYDYFGSREAEDMAEFALGGFEELEPVARLAEPKSQHLRYDTALAFIGGCVVAGLLVAAYAYCTRESDGGSTKPRDTGNTKKSTKKLD